jgi:hypothetical protein
MAHDEIARSCVSQICDEARSVRQPISILGARSKVPVPFDGRRESARLDHQYGLILLAIADRSAWSAFNRRTTCLVIHRQLSFHNAERRRAHK